MEGWIKFWRQTNENEIFRHDRTAWHVFEVLLINCRYGEWKGGRFQLAELCCEKPTTTYQALKRLEKAKMVTLSSNNKYTTISILNWSKYQAPSDNANDNKMTTNRQQNDTSIRIKNRELKKEEGDYHEKTLIISRELGIKPTYKLNEYITKYADKELKPLVDNLVQWCDEKNIKPSGQRLMNWLRREYK